MNLSQDEIQALLNGEATEEPVEDAGSDIMSPEAIAAMLDEAADAPIEEDDVGEVDIMTPEQIAAMLDEVHEEAEDVPMDADVSGGDQPEDSATGDDTAVSESIAADALNAHALADMLTPEEVDILGEVGNISMGAVATTMYSLLDRRVSITTPRVNVFKAADVLSCYAIPFVVATIEYVEGITGTNLLVLKIEDAALITDLLMGGDGAVEEPIELNEMHISAMSEIMNQMMGASSTSLSKLLREPINISPPKSTQVDAGFDVSTLLGDIDMVTKISFDMEIEGLLKSELIQLVPYDVSRDFAKQFMDVGMGDSQGASESKEAAATQTPASAPAAAKPPAPSPAPAPAAAAPAPQIPFAAPPEPASMPPAQPYRQEPYQQTPYPAGYPGAPYPPQPYPPQPYPPQPYPGYPPASGGRLVDVHPMQFQSFDAPSPQGEAKGIDLVYNIPLQVTVELGKTKKEISEILEFNAGTIIVLDKIAGDPVEIVVNGKLIARGEVVVIDESYGVRITDIVNG